MPTQVPRAQQAQGRPESGSEVPGGLNILDTSEEAATTGQGGPKHRAADRSATMDYTLPGKCAADPPPKGPLSSQRLLSLSSQSGLEEVTRAGGQSVSRRA